MAPADVHLVQRGYQAFADRDFETLSGLLDENVRWHGADEEDPQGGCRNRGQVLNFIHDALANGATLEVLEVRQAGDYVLAILQSDREDEDGHPTPHGELVTVQDGKITAMIVYETVAEAIAATT